MSISLEHVTKRYGDIAVVDDVTLEIPHGSLTAVLGPSGSGKSTLLKLISGLERLDAGRVIIDGDDVTDIDPRHRDIGFCFQHYAPFRHMTVAKNVGFGLRRIESTGRADVRRASLRPNSIFRPSLSGTKSCRVGTPRRR